MAKATTWIMMRQGDAKEPKKAELWFGVAAARDFEKVTGKSIFEMDDEKTLQRDGFALISKLILLGFSHLKPEHRPTEAEIDEAIDSLDAEIEPAEPATFDDEASALADVIARREAGQEPKIEKIEGATGTKWKVVDVPTQPAETFTTMSQRVFNAFGEGLPGSKKKRKPGNPTK